MNFFAILFLTNFMCYVIVIYRPNIGRYITKLKRMIMKPPTKDEKKQILMDIAIEQFNKNGMSKTTIATITKEADIGKSTFYEYFKSKEDLLNQWFLSIFDSLAHLEDKLQTITTNKEKILFLVKFFCGSEYTNEKFISMFIEFWRLAFSQKEEASIKIIKAFYSEFSKQLQIYLKDGIKTGEFKDCDTQKVASAIMAQLDGLWLQYMLDRENFNLIEFANYGINTLLKGIEYE